MSKFEKVDLIFVFHLYRLSAHVRLYLSFIRIAIIFIFLSLISSFLCKYIYIGGVYDIMNSSLKHAIVCCISLHSCDYVVKFKKLTIRGLSLAEYNCNWLPSRWLLREANAGSFRALSRYQFPFRVSIRHGRAFPSACRISQGNGNRFEERRCETAVGNTPSACMSPSAIGSSLWCPILADQPLAPFFRHPDLLNVRFFTVHKISLRRHVRRVAAFLSIPFFFFFLFFVIREFRLTRYGRRNEAAKESRIRKVVRDRCNGRFIVLKEVDFIL